MAFRCRPKFISETWGLDIPHHLVDGNDITAVYAATKEEKTGAVGRARVIEAITYPVAAIRVRLPKTGRTAQWDCLSDGRKVAMDLARSDRALQNVAARQVARDRGGLTDVERRRRQPWTPPSSSRDGAPDPAPEQGVWTHLRQGRWRRRSSSARGSAPRRDSPPSFRAETAAAEGLLPATLGRWLRRYADRTWCSFYGTPAATLPTGEVLDLVKGSGRADVGPWLADRRAMDRGATIGVAAQDQGRRPTPPWRPSTPSNTSRIRRADSIDDGRPGERTVRLVAERRRAQQRQRRTAHRRGNGSPLRGCRASRSSFEQRLRREGTASRRDSRPGSVVYLDTPKSRATSPTCPMTRAGCPSAAEIRQARQDLDAGRLGAGDGRRHSRAAGHREAGIASVHRSRSLKPLGVETLVASARKTHRLLVVEHGHCGGVRVARDRGGRAVSSGHPTRSRSRTCPALAPP